MNYIVDSKRQFLKKFAAIGTVGAGMLCGLLPMSAFAAWPEAAFDADDVDSAVNSLYGSAGAEDSDKIMLKAPEIAENGAVVPISVSADIEGVENISILVSNNPSPLAASFELGSNSVANVSTRIKMAKTSDVIALVRTGDKTYKAVQEVKVTIGGCGG